MCRQESKNKTKTTKTIHRKQTAGENLKLLKFLRSIPLFQGISEDELAKVAAVVTQLKFKKHQVIHGEEEKFSSVYIVQEGRVFIYKTTPSGRQFMIDEKRAGEFFAPLATILNKTSTVTNKAGDNVTLLAMKKQDFMTFMHRNPGAVLAIIEYEAERVLSVEAKLVDFLVNNATQRLTKTLVLLISRHGVNLHYTHQEIADMSGTTMETATRYFSELKRDGIVNLNRGNIEVLDRDRLQSKI